MQGPGPQQNPTAALTKQLDEIWLSFALGISTLRLADDILSTRLADVYVYYI